MKVLHVIATIDPRYGGPVEGVVTSSLVWKRYGHERHVLTLDYPSDPWVSSAPVTTFAVGPRGRWHKKAKTFIPWLRYGYTPVLGHWLSRHACKYDAVIVNGLWSYASFGVWLGLRRQTVPYFVFPHGMLDPWSTKAFPVKGFFKKVFWKLVEHRVLRDAKAVLFTCEAEREMASRAFSPYSAREIVVGYGTKDIPEESAEQREAFFAVAPAARGRDLILFLSRIHEKKGIDLLIRAFARHQSAFPSYDLVIAGPDQSGLQPSLVQLSARLGIASRVHWPGMLSGEAKWGAFRAADFFALPSHQENFGIAVAEAMAASKPVLISNKVNIWHEIANAGTGWVVNDDLESVAHGLFEICSLSAEQRREIGAKARRYFKDHFDMERIALQQLELFANFRDPT